MIYKSLEALQIFLADERTDERTDGGTLRGPRRPKNLVLLIITAIVRDFGVDTGVSLHNIVEQQIQLFEFD